MALVNQNTNEYLKIISVRNEPLNVLYYRFPNQQARIDWEAGILANYVNLDLKDYNCDPLRTELMKLSNPEKSIIDNMISAAYEALKNDTAFSDWVDA